MDWAITISIIAASISLGSFCVTLFATYISKKSLNHVVKVQTEEEQKEFERLRVELLTQITDNRKILEKTRIEIGTIKANFELELEPVQVIMSGYTSLFSEFLPTVEASIRQLDDLWQDVVNWTDDKKYKELMNAKATLYRALKNDEQVCESSVYLVNQFKVKLEMAKEHVSHATR